MPSPLARNNCQHALALCTTTCGPGLRMIASFCLPRLLSSAGICKVNIIMGIKAGPHRKPRSGCIVAGSGCIVAGRQGGGRAEHQTRPRFPKPAIDNAANGCIVELADCIVGRPAGGASRLFSGNDIFLRHHLRHMVVYNVHTGLPSLSVCHCICGSYSTGSQYCSRLYPISALGLAEQQALA